MSDPAHGATSEPRGIHNPRFAVTVASVAASFMNILDTTIVNTALPSIDRSFHTTTALGGLTVVSYLTLLVVVMPASGWLGDRFGMRRVFLLSLVMFTGASALCGLAQNLPELVAARVVQGIGGGMLTPTGMAMMYRVYTPTQRLQVAKLTAVPQAMGPVLGPTLGGILVQELSWRWVFWVNIPVGVAVFALSWFKLGEYRGHDRAQPFDGRGLVLSAAGIGLIVYAISQGGNAGWLTAQILVCLILGAAICVAMVITELRSPHPLLALDLIRIRGYRQSLWITLLCGAGFSGVQYVVPVMLQIRDGYTPIQSGLTTFCEAVGVMAGSQVVSRVYLRFGERRIQLVGFVMITALMVLFALMNDQMSAWAIRATMFGVGLGNAGVQLPNQAMAFGEVDPSDTGQASGLYNTSRRFGSALGVAILTSAISSSHTMAGIDSGFTAAFWAAALFTAGGLWIAYQCWRDGARGGLAERPPQTA